MATSFDTIYSRFLSKVSDYEWNKYSEQEIRDELLDYVYAAMSDFKFCKKNLNDIDISLFQFNADLTNDEIEILTHYMVIRWIDTKFIHRQTLLKQNLPSRDFNSYSPGNHLGKLLDARNSNYKRVEHLRVIYTYDGIDPSQYVRQKK